MNFARNTPTPAGDSLQAFIELAKDPKAYEAKLQAMRDAEAAAKAALAEFAAKHEAHNTREQALNERETALMTGVKDLSAKAKAHSDSVEIFLKDARASKKSLDDRHTALIERTTNIKAAEDQAAKRQAAAENKETAAEAALSAAAAHLRNVKSIIAALAPIAEQIAALK